jgi:hypothetical protein
MHQMLRKLFFVCRLDPFRPAKIPNTSPCSWTIWHLPMHLDIHLPLGGDMHLLHFASILTWQQLKFKVLFGQWYEPPVVNLQQPEQGLHQECQNCPQNRIRHLTGSMRRRVEAIIRARSGYTRYWKRGYIMPFEVTISSTFIKISTSRCFLPQMFQHHTYNHHIC